MNTRFHSARRVIAIALPIIATACADSPTAPPSFDPPSPAIVIPQDERSTINDVNMVITTIAGKFGLPYYGKWCGPGWSGGSSGSDAAIDRMDSACRIHDKAYASADSYWRPKYQGTTNKSLKNSYCTSWRTAYKNADNALSSSAAAMPSQSTLSASVTRGDTPDAWGYDKRIYGTHPLTSLGRTNYAYAVRVTNSLGLFKNPDCTISY